MQYAISSKRGKNGVSKRDRRGSSFVELAIGMSALIPIAIALIDLCLMIVGVQTNDAVCRESARVAGKADPRDAQTLVSSIVDQANLRAPFRSTFKVLAVQSTIGERDIKALQPVGGPISGTMTVETEVGIQTNMVHLLYGGKSPMIFHAKQCFPITYIVPPGTSYGSFYSSLDSRLYGSSSLFSSNYLSLK